MTPCTLNYVADLKCDVDNKLLCNPPVLGKLIVGVEPDAKRVVTVSETANHETFLHHYFFLLNLHIQTTHLPLTRSTSN